MYFSRVKKSKAFAEDNDNRRLAPLPAVSWLYYLGKKELYGLQEGNLQFLHNFPN